MIRFMIGLGLLVLCIVSIVSDSFSQLGCGLTFVGFIFYIIINVVLGVAVFPKNVYRVLKTVYKDKSVYTVERKQSCFNYVWWEIADGGDEYSSASVFNTPEEAEAFIKKELSKIPISTTPSSPISVETIDSGINFKEIERT